MSGSEQHERRNSPPYLDESLVINSRLSEVERQQHEDKAAQRKHERSQHITNWLLTILTALLVLTSVVSDVILIRQTGIAHDSAEAAKNAADAARRQTDVGVVNLMASQRAYLAAGDPRQPLFGRGGPIIVPITNYGHVSVVEPFFVFTYVRDKAVAKKRVEVERKTWNVKVPKQAVFAPGAPGAPAFQLAIAPPPLNANDALDVQTGKQGEFINVVGMYNPGFNLPANPFTFCIEYAPSKRMWRDCGHGLYVVDLGTEKPQK